MVHGVVWIKITWPLLAIHHGGLGPYCSVNRVSTVLLTTNLQIAIIKVASKIEQKVSNTHCIAKRPYCIHYTYPDCYCKPASVRM